MFFLALRHLLSKKKQTVLTLLGILLGTAAYVAISGMMLGFQEFIIDQLVNNDSHIRISARDDNLSEHELDDPFFGNGSSVFWIRPPSGRISNPYITNPRFWYDLLDRNKEVTAYAPQFASQVIARSDKKSTTVRIIGTDVTKQTKVTTIANYMKIGRFEDIANGGSRILCGEGLMKKLGAISPQSVNLSIGTSLPQPFKIVGTFLLGVKSIDDGTCFASITDVQKLNETPSRVSDIAIRLKDVRNAENLANQWSILSSDKVQSWNQFNEGIMSVFKTQDIVRNSMTFSILIVACFGIYNILSLAVSHKRKDIAILRSMGFEPKEIVNLFFTQGVILGLVGGITGLILGFFICKYMSTINVGTSRGLGTGLLMVSFNLSIYVKGFLLAFLSSTIAGILPARSAGKLEPIEIIRSDSAG